MIVVCADIIDGNMLRFVWHLVSCVENFFRLYNANMDSLLDIRNSIIWNISIWICMLLYAGAFCNFPISVIWNEIDSTKASMYLWLYRNSFFECLWWQFCTWFVQFEPLFFCRLKNLLRKIFDSTVEIEALWYNMDMASWFLLKKYPEWMLLHRATYPFLTIDRQMPENVEIHPFCQRKGTKMLHRDTLESWKCFVGPIWSYFCFDRISTCCCLWNGKKSRKFAKFTKNWYLNT